MPDTTTKTYSLKRDILTFAGKISHGLPKPEKKFVADMVYGMLASESCLLTDIADKLHEKTKKVNTVERLSRNLLKGTPKRALLNYLATVKKMAPVNPVIHVDDTDVVKRDGHKFEALGIVRDGSGSGGGKNVYGKGYHVTEATALTHGGHPVSVFSRVHSSNEKSFVSVNAITFAAIDRCVKMFKKATFVMDRGYDFNEMFKKLFDSGQDFVIRLTRKRKLLLHGKWVTAGELANRRKGKIRMPLNYKGREHDAYLSHIKTRITAAHKDIYLVLVHGISGHPMMLATNKEIKSKEDVMGVARIYFSRWRVEEYFRAKKQLFKFENFRVRKLKAINALNFHMTACMAYLAHLSMKPETNHTKVAVIKAAAPIREKVMFAYYRLARGIRHVLAYAREGTRFWFRTTRPRYRQMRMRLII